ncbi:hypothetical protein BDF19DRAFT_436990 [Syncephalis fuscata]|nr:hypothetical protein BDF19DRAFT_436990 [Syncephalis fuscata]
MFTSILFPFFFLLLNYLLICCYSASKGFLATYSFSLSLFLSVIAHINCYFVYKMCLSNYL